MNMKVWSEFKTGTDGKLYGLRYLLTEEEVRGLQAAGVIGPVSQIHDMKPKADQVMAAFERDNLLHEGGSIQ